MHQLSLASRLNLTDCSVVFQTAYGTNVISLPTWVVGAVLAAVIALTAVRARALTRSGGVAAWMAGTVAMGAGWDWGIILISYFVTSSALSRYGRDEKARRSGGRTAKMGARDAAQVAANGGVYAVAAVAHWAAPHPAWQALGLGALAASAADTWATEIGTLAGATPRSVISGAPVAVGTSGGVTAAGLAASVSAAVFVALLAALLGWAVPVTAGACVGGVCGSLLDSVAGATVQGRFWCGSCEVETEARRHHCGAITRHRRGSPWLDNDGVNALATMAGATLAVTMATALT